MPSLCAATLPPWSSIRFFTSAKKVEGARHQRAVHADAGIGDGQAHAGRIGFQADVDGAARRRVLGGVVEQIAYHLHQPLGVAVHCQARRRHIEAQLLVALQQQWPHLFDGGGDDVGDVDRRPF